jgi:hypothetical protein
LPSDVDECYRDFVVARVLAKGVVREGDLPIFIRASALGHSFRFEAGFHPG